MSVTWLHVSDFHIRAGDPYDRDVVLRALVSSVAEYRTQGHAPDLIFATGDIAHSGKPKEYDLATKFFDDLLAATALDKGRLFVIAGNHDVDRELGVGLSRTLESREQADTYFRPGLPKAHLTQKLRAFAAWHNTYFAAVRAAHESSTCGPVETLEVRGHRLGILPMNSSLFCQGDDDHDKLWIGRRCLDAALEALRSKDTELNIALVHHPLDWLSALEGSNIRATIESNIDILLRGHLHETRIETVASADGQVLHCAAGAAYQTRKWPNRALYCTFDDDCLTVFPIRYEDAARELWTTDPSIFPRQDKHRKTFTIPRLAVRTIGRASPAPTRPERASHPRFRSNISSRGTRPFIGRDSLIAQIRSTLPDPSCECVLVIHGQPGVGKSELAREFARLHRDRYTGGTFYLDASKDALAIDLAWIGKNILDLDFPSALPLNDQGQQTFYSFCAAPVLLIYDNVASIESVVPWLPPSGMPCHVLITTLLESGDPAWPCVQVAPLSEKQSIELVEQLAGSEMAARYGQTIATHAGGLPVQIVPAVTTLAYEQRHGRSDSVRLTLAREASKSFRAVYDRLPQPARLLLHAAAFLNPQRIPGGELSHHLRSGLDWSEADVARALDACLDLHLLDGIPDPSMHQLFASFLLQTPPSVEDQSSVARISAVQRRRLAELADALFTNPADTETATTLMSYPLRAAAWVNAGQPLSTEEGEALGRALCQIGRFIEALPWFLDAVRRREHPNENGHIDHASLRHSLHQVGSCLSSTGRYEEARPWFERAVAEAEKADVHGRIDHESLGRGLHQVGECLSSTGRYEEARPWFERAVAEKEKGDVHGRIDHDSLGSSLHMVGFCLSNTGRYEEARPWFERAVAEVEKGDVHRRIDHESLGSSLHQLGDCLSSTGRYEEARPWFERAVAEAEKGDVHGRIDHDSLGRSLDQVGECLSSTGRYEEARPWVERAVAAKEKGDVHGRIDHDSLGSSLHMVGHCVSNTGRYEEARPWFERAAAEAEKGDVYGRIDRDSLGRSLNRVGECLSSTGRYEEARSWFERAVAEKEKGDVHGRIDHASLSRSLLAGAACLNRLGQTEQAREWERQASETNPSVDAGVTGPN